MKYPRKFGYVPQVLDSSRFFFTDTVWMVGPLGQAISIESSQIHVLEDFF